MAWAGELPEADAAPDVADARADEALEAMPVPADGTVELTPGTMGALRVGTGATGVLPEGTTGAGGVTAGTEADKTGLEMGVTPGTMAD